MRQKLNCKHLGANFGWINWREIPLISSLVTALHDGANISGREAMAVSVERLLTPKQRANAALKVVRAIRRRERRNNRQGQQQVTSHDGGRSEYLEEIERILTRATEAAFEKAGLDINDSADWKVLLPWLAWAIYDKNPGRPLEWSEKELRRLLADVRKLKSNDAKRNDTKCCEDLAEKDIYYLGKGATASTLRRRLQQAKKLDLKAKK